MSSDRTKNQVCVQSVSGLDEFVVRSSNPRGRASAVRGASLGNSTKFASTASQCRKSTTATVYRFALQAGARALLPKERVAGCMRFVRKDRGEVVHVLYVPAVQRAHYGNLTCCGSVWTCPVCSSKISERRRVELEAGITAAAEQGSVVLLVTFTVRHDITDGLTKLLDGLKAAFRRLKVGRSWQAFSQSYGISGSVCATELTYGVNGWHPHLHALFFVRADVSPVAFEHDMRVMWLHVLPKSGLTASWEYGVDVRIGDAAVFGYVAKFGNQWTIAHEMTKSPVKVGRAESRSMADLLVAATFEQNQEAAKLWQQYAILTKGVNQLRWSRGLRSSLGLGVEVSDEVLAEEESEMAVLLASLSMSQWRVVLGNDARGELLDVASSGDAAQVWAFLRSFGVR